MKISVVLSSYNGEKYIFEQLSSILNQTRRPDEVIIVDDCSSDNTTKIVQDFIDNFELGSTWILLKNDYNKGWRKNFKDAIIKAKGELIFTCDQDDIWMNNKIEICENEMRKNENIKVLFSNYITFGAQKKKIGKNNYSIEKYDYQRNFFQNCPGCVMCVRNSFVSKILEYWKDNFPHDSALFRFAIMEDGLYKINAYLIQWRVHADSSYAEESKEIDFLYRKKWLDYAEQIVSELINFCKQNRLNNEKEKIQMLEKYNKWLVNRRNFTLNKDLKSGFRLLAYYKCYPYKIQLITDWLFFIRSI